MIRPYLLRTAVAASMLLVLGCDGGEKRAAVRPFTVQNCKVSLGEWDYSRAIANAEGVLVGDPRNSEARYCAVLAHLGTAFQAWGAMFSLLTSQLSPPTALAPANGKDLKKVVGGLTSDIEEAVRKIDAHIFILAQEPDPQIHLDAYKLDISDVVVTFLMLAQAEVKVGRESHANLRGTWDKSHLLMLGAFVNAVQTMRDYLFAHNMTVNYTDFPNGDASDVSMEYGRFFTEYPQFFSFDAGTPDEDRLRGSDFHDGLKNQALAAVSYLVGRSDTVDRVAPANRGLGDAIAQSAASTSTDAPVRWIDADRDGVPEKLIIPSLPQLQLIVDGEKLDDPQIENPLGQDPWKALMTLAADVRANLEADRPAPISLQPLLHVVWEKLAADPANAQFRLLHKEMPDILAINPGVFFSKPVAIRDLLPFVFQFTAGGRTYADLAIESEYYVSATENYLEKLGEKADFGTDFAHFDYTGFPQTVSEYSVTSYSFFNGGREPEVLAPDGITATAKSPLLYSIAFPHPGLGGLVVPDPKGFTGTPTFDTPTNAGLNEALNRFIQYYCLDLNKGTTDSVNEGLYGAANLIGDCTN